MSDAIRVVEDNVEATEAWNGPLFDVWIEYRDIVAEGLRDHGEAALAASPPHEGDRVLDIGCGLGDTTVRLAGLVGSGGHAHGVDVAERMIETAIAEAAAAGDRERQLRDLRRRGDQVRPDVRLRVLAHGDDVLRQPGGGASQRARGAGARAGS